MFILYFSPFYAVGAAKNPAKKADVCFPDASKEYKKLKKTVAKIEKNAQDNFLYILPVYNADYQIDTTSKIGKTLSSIIQKATEEIDYAETKDSAYCPAIAEIYKLKGMALFYQKQYPLAYETFETVVTEYQNTASLCAVYLWLARTAFHLQENEKTVFFLSEAEKCLDTTQKDMLVYFLNLSATQAMHANDYPRALEYLTRAINTAGSSALHTRLSFIAAQLAEEQKSYPLAMQYYYNVSKKTVINIKHPFSPDLMKSCAVVHRHLCEKKIEKQILDSIAEQQWKALHPVPKEFEPTMIESYHDSSFFGRHYPYYFNDEAAMFFLNEATDDNWDEENEAFGEDEDADFEDGEEPELSNDILDALFENWESIAIHIPKTDFSNMRDTIYIPLTDNALKYELPHFGAVVSRFGWRRYRYHYGTDLKGSIGDSICCVFDGVVRIAVRNKTYGNVIIVRHFNGLETFYAHCSKLLVVPNQEVKAGELIGLIGNTGRSRGPHLHFESRYKGAAFNPEYMINFENKRLVSDTLMLTRETFNYKNTYSTPSVSSGTKYHRVRSGETLSTLAKKYRTSIANIKKINGLKSDVIREGQNLRIP